MIGCLSGSQGWVTHSWGIPCVVCILGNLCPFFSLKIFIYDGKTGEKVGALGGSKAHDGGIYAVSHRALGSGTGGGVLP